MKLIRSRLFICVAISIFFVTWIYFFDEYNIRKQSEKKAELKALQEALQDTENKINDLKLKNELIENNPEAIEAVARDKYYMKRANEDLYIFLKENEKGELVNFE